MPPFRLLTTLSFGLVQITTPALLTWATLAPHTAVAAPRPPMPGPNLGVGPLGNGASGLGGQTSPGSGILGGGGGGIFGGGNGGGGGGFGGGGGGPFGGGQLGGNRASAILQSAQFLMLLMSLFQKSNTQSSAGTAIMNLANTDDSTSASDKPPTNAAPPTNQGTNPPVPSGQWGTSNGKKPAGKLPIEVPGKPGGAGSPPLGSFFEKGYVTAINDDSLLQEEER